MGVNSLNGNTDKIQVRDINYVKGNVYNAQRKTLQKLPKNALEVHDFLNDTEYVTTREENFNNIIVKKKVLLYFLVK